MSREKKKIIGDLQEFLKFYLCVQYNTWKWQKFWKKKTKHLNIVKKGIFAWLIYRSWCMGGTWRTLQLHGNPDIPPGSGV